MALGSRFKRNTLYNFCAHENFLNPCNLYNFCAPENFLNPCNLSGTSSLTTTTYTITSSVTSVCISSDVGRPSLLIRQSKDALWYSLLHHRRSQHRQKKEHRLAKRTSDCNQRERPVAWLSTSVPPRPKIRGFATDRYNPVTATATSGLSREHWLILATAR